MGYTARGGIASVAVYVDKARNAYRQMKMCHMVADTIEELHMMAEAIGIKRKWFQSNSHPHYDICQSKRARAISAGAIEIDRRGLVSLIRQHRLIESRST